MKTTNVYGDDFLRLTVPRMALTSLCAYALEINVIFTEPIAVCRGSGFHISDQLAAARANLRPDS